MARTKNIKHRRDAGFTLIEVLVVLAIISLVAVLVAPRLLGQLEGAKQTASRVQLRSISSAIETFRIDMGRYPSDSEGLSVLIRPPGDTESSAQWRGPYLDAETPNDAWGRPFLYSAPSEAQARPRIGTLGADGKPGGSGVDSDVFVGDPV